MTSEERKLFDRHLHANGFKESDLTREESAQLLEEVRAEIAGRMVFNSVLDEKPRYTLKKD